LIGRILNRQQQYGDAILYLKRIPEYLKTAETELLLGESLVKTGRYTEGLAILQSLLN